MKRLIYIGISVLVTATGCAQSDKQTSKMKNDNFNPLTAEEKRVIVHKGTERAFTGEFNDFYEEGIYLCKRCGAELYKSTDKFKSGCGWPSFDDEIPNAVKRTTDFDGRRTEITCNTCDAHLGHVFLNEGFTDKNTRHCVNSISLEFIPDKAKTVGDIDTAYFAGGCFWGVEYYLEQARGVTSVISGYMGGIKENPTYTDVSSHKTGHAETVQVVFHPSQTDYEKLARLFFEIHDPTQVNRQGPDIGNQYRSAVFYKSMEQKRVTEKLIKELELNGYNAATRLQPATTFWKAEDYHQDYYIHKNKEPYCHARVKRF